MRWRSATQPGSLIITWRSWRFARTGKDGIGGALLRAHHAALDRDRIPAYVEASDLRTRRLYQVHGYADCGAPLTFPGAVMFLMGRPPQPGQPSRQALPSGLAGDAGPGPAPGGGR